MQLSTDLEPGISTELEEAEEKAMTYQRELEDERVHNRELIRAALKRRSRRRSIRQAVMLMGFFIALGGPPLARVYERLRGGLLRRYRGTLDPGIYRTAFEGDANSSGENARPADHKLTDYDDEPPVKQDELLSELEGG
jgi:hypothetical protein